MKFDELFVCPICQSSFCEENNTLRCEKGHCFDISASGYVNLLKPGKMNNAKAGDSKEMIRARTAFLTSGVYEPIRNTVCELCSTLGGAVIIDAGCGEGYYTEGIAATNQNSCVLGFDMSKFGCEHGAKSAKRNGVSNIKYSVSSIFEMPVVSECADIIVNMFAPVASDEFARVLKRGGYLIVASSGINHLDGLKSVLYEDVYKNEEKILNYDGFELCECKVLKYNTTVYGTDTIYSLFTMTPYYHRTSLEDKKKLEGVSEINTTIEVNFAIYKKI